MPFQASQIAYSLGFSPEISKQLMKVFMNLYQVFVTYDAELVEINPLFITNSDLVVAGDGKLMIDDEHYGFIAEAKDLFNNALGKILEN